MTADIRVVSCFAALLLLIECAATISAAPMASAAPGNAQITVLYDAFGKASTMQKDWGYAALVEYGGKRILFDTAKTSRTRPKAEVGKSGTGWTHESVGAKTEE
jgi:7,8-dihydropterin-6-yl-methyl-4-(beta-D-ribofuranosyl)aminobenzene 5'-phosphate synthase